MKAAITWGAAGLIALAGCAQRPRTDPSVITIAVFASPNNFDPRVGTDQVSQKVYQLVYDNLLNLDDELKVAPGLATHWEQPDDRSFVLHLRRGVRFHDRHELTSADVAHTFSSLIDPAFVSARRGACAALARVEAIDPYTARFALKEPSGSFLIQLVLPVIPAGAGPELRNRPIGTGPYKFASYAVDDRLDLTAFSETTMARPKTSVVPPTSWAYAPDAFQFTYDPVRARTLLDEANYRDPDGDGPLPRLHLTLKVPTNEFYRLQAAVIQQDLRAVGIDLDVRSYEFATLSKDVASGNFQLVTLQWVGISDPDMLRRVFHSKQMPPLGFNRGFYSNPEVDRLIDEATAAADLETRKRAYQEVQRRVAEDAPYVSLWYKTNVAVAQHELTGIRLTPLAAFLFLKDVTRRETATRASR